MRESIGATWVLGIVIVFIVLFTGFLSLAINYSRAFKVKNEVLSIIEEHEGFTETVSLKSSSKMIIDNYLYNSAYSATGTCPDDYDAYKIANNESNKDSYCIKKIQNGTKAYYKIVLFFKFDLPMIGDIAVFKVEGTTTEIEFPA